MASARQPSKDEKDLDSVDVEFGNEYSDETLNILRGVNRPEYLEESSSLDPVDDIGLYIDNQLNIPPAAYDALQAVGKEEIAALQAAKDAEPDKATENLVRYRQKLAEGTSHDDLTWLKLRAYHRAMEQTQLRLEADKEAEDQHRLQEYQVPTDKVPTELLNLTPAQLAQRRKLAAIAAAKVKHQAVSKLSPAQRILARPEPSDESEWDATSDQQQTTPNHFFQGVTAALREYSGVLQLLPKQTQQASQAEEPVPVQSEAPIKRRVLRTVYTQEYLEQQELKARLQLQQRQRHAAFWLSFATATCAYCLQLLRRRSKKQTKPAAKSQPAKNASTTKMAA